MAVGWSARFSVLSHRVACGLSSMARVAMRQRLSRRREAATVRSMTVRCEESVCHCVRIL